MEHRRRPNQFQIKQLETYKVIRHDISISDETQSNIVDPRLLEGRIMPVYYNGLQMSFNPPE